MAYGSDDGGSGGYYSVPGPGGYLDARAYLDGPGTRAYLQDGPNSSYAYEGQNGSVFEVNTTTFKGGFEQSASYEYANSSYRYAHNAYDTYYNPPVYRTTGGFGYTTTPPAPSYDGYYAPYGQSYGVGLTSHYSATDVEVRYDGSYKTISSQSLSETDFADGTYRAASSTSSGTYEDGVRVPGSTTHYSATSYGYLGSYPG